MPDDTPSGPFSIESPPPTWPGRLVRLASLSRIQSVVAILAGSATVLGAAFSVGQVGRPARTGTLITVVHTAGVAQSVTNATVEILTTDNALVASLTPDADGRAMQALREGVYLVRVSEPRAGVDVHRIDVQAGQTIEVKATLRAGSSPSAGRAINKGVSALRRAFGVR